MWGFVMNPGGLLEERARRKSVPPLVWSLRPVGPNDEAFLREALYGAAFWGEGEHPPPDQALRDPTLRRYVEGWGREGDAGMVAVGEDDRPIGACWIRRFPADARGYGFIAPEVPELSVYVSLERRGLGIGGRLLQAVLERAAAEGCPAVSLSVSSDNPAMRLYARHGFVRVGFDGHSYTMRADLA